MNLPVPDCTLQRSACELAKVLNEYDGFNPNPRITVRFSGPVDLETLRRGVFLLALENMTAEEAGTHYTGTPIPINQLIWDPKSYSLFAKPDNVLDQHRRYALIVTSAVRDTRGNPVEADAAFHHCISRPGSDAYCGDLANHLSGLFALAEQLGGSNRIVGASIFTTLSVTAWLEKARDLLPLTPPAVRLVTPRSLFPVPDIASVVMRQHTGVNPPAFNNGTLVTTRMAGIRALAFGSYRSPSYLVTQDKYLWSPNRFRMIATIPSASSLQPPAGVEEVYFQATLPDAPKPSGGYPVVIAAHGSPGHKFNPTGQGIAQTMAAEGFATIAITATGQGFGPQTTLLITEKSGAVTEIPGGGRGTDLDGNGTISSAECDPSRDCMRQTVLDMLQLVRAIQAGIDLDGDGVRDLDPGRIFYHGFSYGALLGAVFASLEPSVTEVVLNVGGGSVMDLNRWSPALRPGMFQTIFGGRTPSVAPNSGSQYDEDYVLRDQPVKISAVEGALELQEIIETIDWMTAPAEQLHYAPHLRASTLPGVPIKRVLFQMCLGDQTVPNPTNSAFVRAAGAPEWAVLYRHDLARAAFPELPASAHTFLVPGTAAASVTVAQAAQRQAALFYSTGHHCGLLAPCIPDMSEILVPVFGKNLFEIPLVLPEALGFLAP